MALPKQSSASQRRLPAEKRKPGDYSHLSPEVRERVERRAKLSAAMASEWAARFKAAGLKVVS